MPDARPCPIPTVKSAIREMPVPATIGPAYGIMLEKPEMIPSGRKNGTPSIARKVVVNVALIVQMSASPPR